MANAPTLQDTLLRQLEELHQAREDLLFECQIDRADVHEQWNQLDDALRSARAELNRMNAGAGPSPDAASLADTSNTLLNAVRIQIARIRRHPALQGQEG